VSEDPTSRAAGCTVPEERFEAFVSGELRGAERIEILEHLLSGCPRCRGFVPDAERSHEADAASAQRTARSAAALVERLSAHAARLDKELAETGRRLPEFLTHPAERQRTILANRSWEATYSFVDGLVDAAFEEIYDRPRRSEELLELADGLAGELDEERYGPRIVADVRARVLAHRANVHRTFGRLREARGLLARARETLAEGSLDPLAEAELEYFEGTLLFAERRVPAAIARLRKARATFEEFSDAYHVGLCLNAEGALQEAAGDATAAVEAAQAAIERVDPALHPRLAGAARLNLIWNLMSADRTEEALARLDEFRPFFATFADGPTRNRLGWRHARLAALRGDERTAERLFREVADEFLELGLPYEAAGVSLELALLLHDQGRFAEVREIATVDLSTFGALGVEPEAIAAWVVFRSSAEAEAVNRGLLERLSSYFRTAKVRPGIPFEG